MSDFKSFGKIPRWSRDIIITEKIDGTNAQILIVHKDNREELPNQEHIALVEDYAIYAGSRNQYISVGSDNHGFAKFVASNAEELVKLGPGRHFGEWWGSGIQRGYGLQKGEKRFSLFNVSKWSLDRPTCCEIVPVLYHGPMDEKMIDKALDNLRCNGSHAATGFMRPEGIIIFHVASGHLYKKTLENDHAPKSKI